MFPTGTQIVVFFQTLHLQQSPFSLKIIVQKAKLVSQRDPSLAVLIKSADAAWENTNNREKNYPGLTCHYRPGPPESHFYLKSEYTFFFLILPFNFYPLLLTPSCHENKVTKDTAFIAVMTQLSRGSPSNNSLSSF